ncbi:MAG TPA: sigma-70 family RNA polymerase sigma factor [Candidatus Limnocylindria bacterium]|jgi:RNA polymerase sigma factor (sigma-70 family)|nr:sigma-70 family RNA polymerase sigma factor [Candidatus Limnocylindria bacterium]
MQDETLALLPAMAEARERFMELVAELRPELHRYCARMTGSVFDGEDVVQDTLAKAYYALGQMREPPNLKPWLFRIAHNTATDFLRRYDRKHVELVPEVPERAELDEAGVDPVLIEAALTVFVELTPVQRGALILKDVLGHSLEEVAATMQTSVGAVKAALSRARANIARTSPAVLSQRARPATADERANLRRYVDLFNDRNWDRLRALLGEESRLDQVSFVQRRTADARYFDRYAEIIKTEDIRAEAGLVDGVAAIAMFRPASSPEPAYFVLLEWTGGRISLIRDFRYVPYIASAARFSRAE